MQISMIRENMMKLCGMSNNEETQERPDLPSTHSESTGSVKAAESEAENDLSAVASGSLQAAKYELALLSCQELIDRLRSM